MRLQGKKALITGGSRGIGRAIAIGMAREGADVAINYVSNQEAARQVIASIKKLGRNAIAVKADVAIFSEIEQTVEKIWQELGGIDILVNNAGIAYIEPFDKISEETWDKTLNVNLKGTFFCSQIVAKRMIQEKRRGKIINMSATNSVVAEADTTHYNASKGGINMVTKSLAIELAPYGINVNGIAPGVIQTDIDEVFFADKDFERYYRNHIPMGKFGTVEDCAGAAIFLASDESNYITGHTIVIDGGLISDQVPKLKKML